MSRRLALLLLTSMFVAMLASNALAGQAKLYIDSVLADAQWQAVLERIVYDEVRKAGFGLAATPDQADYLMRVALLSSQNTREWNWLVILLFWWTWPFVGWTHDWVTANVEITLVRPTGEPAFSQVFSGEAQEDVWFSDLRGPEYKMPDALAQAVQSGMRSMRNLAMR